MKHLILFFVTFGVFMNPAIACEMMDKSGSNHDKPMKCEMMNSSKSKDHGAHFAHASGASVSGESTKAFQKANEVMHRDMNITFSGDADVDFVYGMIPHHQGAVDMARVVLEHGKDPELKALAKAIIEAQQLEIGWMRRWLEHKGHKAPAFTPVSCDRQNKCESTQ